MCFNEVLTLLIFKRLKPQLIVDAETEDPFKDLLQALFQTDEYIIIVFRAFGTLSFNYLVIVVFFFS